MDQLLTVSQKFWDAMEHADEAGMRACADPNCNFVHIGITCKLDKEIEFYTSGAFQPTDITFHGKRAEVFGATGVVAYRLRLQPAAGRQGDHAPLYGDGGLCPAGGQLEAVYLLLYSAGVLSQAGGKHRSL